MPPPSSFTRRRRRHLPLRAGAVDPRRCRPCCQARERELANLRRKGERTAAQLDRLQQDHARQGAVLKRKNEEVIALHKRGQHGRLGAAPEAPRGGGAPLVSRPAWGAPGKVRQRSRPHGQAIREGLEGLLSPAPPAPCCR